MNTKVYEKTRYQNIYRHKKNKNYLVMISKPVKTSISSYNGKKILKLEDALSIRDNPKLKIKKQTETPQNNTFDSLWYDYITWCKNVDKQAYNTYYKKEKLYKKYFKGKFGRINKITKDYLANYINKLDCSLKQKNEILKNIKPFFNWCIEQNVLIVNPAVNIKPFRVEKAEMKYWTPEEIKRFFKAVQNDIDNNYHKEIAYRTYMFVLIGFSLGARTGETLKLRFSDFNYNTNVVTIRGTKNKTSDREVDVSPKLIEELKKYYWHLINEFDYDIIKDELIFCNHKTKKPITDTTMRKHFYYYCDIARVSKIRMYDLRHTYVATMMMEGKELYYISQRIGHSSYNTTIDKYGHLSNKTRKEIAELTDKYV